MTITYVLLCALRVACCFLPGYVHPDEWFQSPEVMASRIFGVKGYIPWEYSPDFPCRSPSVAMLVTGIPFLVVRAFTAQPRSLTLFLAPRFYMCALSFILDGCVWALHKMFPKEVNLMPTLTLLGLAWPVLVFGSRPFSNTVELLTLAATMTLCFRFHQSKTHKTAFSIGVVVGLGLFNRVTFAAFSASLGLFFAWTLLKEKDGFKGLVLFSLTALLGFLLAICTIVYCDSVYFGRFVIAPLNFFQYNSDPSNLALHGVHPRWLHVAVNMPILLGPLCAIIIASFLALPKHNVLVTVCLGVIMASLASLSAAPHQEFRFLLPLVFPAVLVGQWVTRRKKVYRAVLVLSLCVFSGFFVCFFGLAHQGGVTPALIHVGGLEKQNTTIAFCGTYMPPRHLLGVPADNDDFEVADLGGKCDLRGFMETSQSARNVVWVAAPASLGGTKGRELAELGFTLERSFWPHLSTEYPPHSVDEMSLNLYKKVNDPLN